MLYWSAVFFVLAIIAGLFGFGGITSGAGLIARGVSFLFVVLFCISLLVGIFRYGRGA